VTRDEKQHKLFVKVVNASSDAETIGVSLDGIGHVAPEAKLITLSGKTPNATNSINDPDAVVPVTSKVTLAGTKFEQRFAPYSINVLVVEYR
jgi:alpha-N-arabinofuranosidase